MDLNQIFLLATLLLALAIIVVGSLLFVRRLKIKGRLTRALNMSLFLITLPKKKVKKEEGEVPKSEKEIISVMEQLYASLSNIRETKDVFIYGQPHLVFELATPQVGEEIIFYLAVPRGYEEVIEKQIHGFYPEASIVRTEDYNIFNPAGAVSGAYLKLARSYVLPFKTYQNLEKDPLNEITNTLSKLEEKGEGAAIQIVFRPTSLKWQKLSRDIAKEMQEGKSFPQAKSAAGSNWFVRLIKEFRGGAKPSQKEDRSKEEKQPVVTPGQEEIIKALEEKASKVGFDVNLRLLVSAANQQRAEQILSHLEAAFVQFNAPNLNQLKSFRLKKGRGLKKLIYNFSFRFFNRRQRMLLNTEELTSLFHFPTTTIETPKVKFLKAEPAAPPANLPKEGAILGKNLYRGIEAVIRMQENDRRRHLYVIGQTGTGKSVFLRNMIVQDIKEGHGVGVLDPHGDLVESILGLVPQERAEDVVVLDPADLERPLGLNMLEYDSKYPEQKTFVVNELINIFDKLYDLKATGGPMFEQYTRNALLLLMDDPSEKFTLMEVPKVLADKEFRDRLLVKCRNMVVKDFWEKEAEKAGGEAALQNIVPYITSKFNVFIANDYMRPIIGQSVSSLNFRQIIDEQKILLVNLSKGRLGDVNSSLLGLIVTGKLLMAAFSRIDIAEEERKDFYLYMDEFQNFATDSIATILSEARKYRLCLTMAHQFIGQLEDKIREAVFGNVGSMVSFRVGADDAEFLVKQFEPVFDTNDLINIDNFNAYIKLMINNETSKPFNLLTYPPEKEKPAVAQAIKELARLKYGREKAAVEKEISSRWQMPSSAESPSPPSPDMEVR
ncbi:MAG: type IV secretory system conjugative DNA transfer family protein [Candidatus Portnoybacteria bacterium]|nr:type IV secretory system conjugative DNA transfer family protein [Candidatus Portnoybacteria bacterium]